MNIKKKLTLALALVLTLTALSTSCTKTNEIDGLDSENTGEQNTELDANTNQTDENSDQELVLPEAVETEADTKIVMNVGGANISHAMLRYFILNYKAQYPGNNDELWTKFSVEEIKNLVAIERIADEIGAQMPEDYKKQNIDNVVAQTIERINADENTSYEKELETYYLTDVLFRDIQGIMALQNYVYTEYYTEGKEFFDATDEDILNYINENYVRVKHILIKTTDLDDAQKAEARTRADTILEAARSGASFEVLVTEYSEDGMDVETGYYFTYNQMVPEFEEKSFALEVGEISDIVESTYGYHIIKKYEMEESHILNDEALRTNALNSICINKFTDEVFAKSEPLEVVYTDLYEQSLADILTQE